MSGDRKLADLGGVEAMLGMAEAGTIIADMVVEDLGVGPDRGYFTYHDVVRAAAHGARVALDFAVDNPPSNWDDIKPNTAGQQAGPVPPVEINRERNDSVE